MHIALVGAGALGWIYGARLAQLAGAEVTLVGTKPRAPTAQRLERVDAAETTEWSAAVVPEPPEADLYISCVRYEHLDAMAARLTPCKAPVLVLTPMMPPDHARLASRLGPRLVPAMPSVVGYESAPGTIRYWLPRAATTLIEEGDPSGITVELSALLKRAGISSKVEPNVQGRNVATTVSFLPFAFGLDIADGIEALLKDGPLFSLALEASSEGRRLGELFGALAPWATMAMPFVRPLPLKIGIGLVRSRAPEVLRYASLHFGRKLHTQNVAMGAVIATLMKAHGVKGTAFEKLRAQLSP